MKTLANFIDGKLVAPAEGIYIDSLNPATGEVNGKVPDSTAKDVNLAVEAANRAFPSWSKTTRAYRSALMIKVADLLEQKLEEFALEESKDQGKPVSLARTVDIPRAIYNFRFFANSILNRHEKATELDGIALNYVHRTSAGVAGLISPWNLPLYLLTWKIAPAMAAGCTSVCKPSEFTSVTAWMLCSILNEAGVVNMVFGTGPNAGAPLVSHPDVPLISFTGGTATGELIYKAAAPLNKKLSLELGGKNANIVFADADFDEALKTTVNSSFANQGEICLCGSRIFVEKPIFDRFTKELAAAADKLVVGNPTVTGTTTGALVSEQHLAKVASYIDLARAEGGTVLSGGSRVTDGALARGFFIRPTVIVGLPAIDCRVQQEEIFGPVVTVTPFDTEDEAVRFANSTKYGLSASLWTENGKRAHRVAQQLQVSVRGGGS
ncbi:aldehyde dehydrogenase domain-containing protein [Blyttiomyces helicus]|uniref:Aldehyde dehydrogenase domain-containing protein n=2 Tax=Blyttiomyces helicus TaxID=388810 RepID=A0A4P9W6D5_9FUNG|nr:aldehyde dehydrogenase domain-containing protein [Blyttiomyces helicus]|eukprot:RKO86923.1 aldehyde dehydrogenase domain-containing protein [Blyttiomyces helicus]